MLTTLRRAFPTTLEDAGGPTYEVEVVYTV